MVNRKINKIFVPSTLIVINIFILLGVLWVALENIRWELIFYAIVEIFIATAILFLSGRVRGRVAEIVKRETFRVNEA